MVCIGASTWALRVALVALILTLSACEDHTASRARSAASMADERFLQEISHKSIYKGFEPTEDVPVSTAWEDLPFGALETGSMASLFPEIHCVVAIKDGALYGAVKKTPVPRKTSLESPYHAWALLNDSNSGAAANKIAKEGKNVFAATDDNILKFTLKDDCTVESVEKVLNENKNR